MIKCPYCNSENKDSARYCRSCGKLLPGANFAENPEIDSLIDKIEELQNESKHYQEKINESKQKLEQQDVNRRQLESRILKLNSTINEKDKAISNSQQENKKLEEKINELESKASGKIWLWLAVIGLSISCLIMCAGNNNDDSQTYNNENSNDVAYEDSINAIINSYQEALSELRDVYTDVMPVVIKDITILGSNNETTIESRNSTYIYLNFKAYSIIEGQKEFFIKYTDQYGNVRSGNMSPKGYSFDQKIELKPFETAEYSCDGWGAETKGNWAPGNYKVEIFINKKCIGIKNFTVL